MATTREKMQAFSSELRETAAEDTSKETRPLVELIQIAGGFGIDVFSWLIPGSDADADVFIDQLLALLLRVRGDDLPPFDPGLYGEVVVNGGADQALADRYREALIACAEIAGASGEQVAAARAGALTHPPLEEWVAAEVRALRDELDGELPVA